MEERTSPTIGRRAAKSASRAREPVLLRQNRRPKCALRAAIAAFDNRFRHHAGSARFALGTILRTGIHARRGA